MRREKNQFRLSWRRFSRCHPFNYTSSIYLPIIKTLMASGHCYFRTDRSGYLRGTPVRPERLHSAVSSFTYRYICTNRAIKLLAYLTNRLGRIPPNCIIITRAFFLINRTTRNNEAAPENPGPGFSGIRALRDKIVASVSDDDFCSRQGEQKVKTKWPRRRSGY